MKWAIIKGWDESQILAQRITDRAEEFLKQNAEEVVANDGNEHES